MNQKPEGQKPEGQKPGVRASDLPASGFPASGFWPSGLLVAVIGDVMLDRFLYGAAERISPEAPVPVLRIEREQPVPGGAANVARNVAALGGRASLVGLVGNDDAGASLSHLLAQDSRIESRLVADPARPTTVKSRFVSGGQQLLRADREISEPVAGAAEAMLLQQALEAIRAADAVVLSDYAKGTLSETVLARLIAEARREGKPVIADPKSPSLARYRGVDLLTPNRHELAAATRMPCGDDAAVAAAARAVAAATGIETLLVTRGDQGMTLIRQGCAPLHLHTEAREVFDVSGAGDTVVATLALSLAAAIPLPQAAALANLAAGIVVGKRGTAVVSAAELEAEAGNRKPEAGAAGLLASGLLDSGRKIVDLAAAADRVRDWRASGLRVGFTNGCFDLVHPGHVALLAQARAACDRLVVGLNADASVRRLKGPSRPIQSEPARAVVLASLGSVDLVVPFEEDTPLELIRALRPDLLVKGADYRLEQVVGAELVQSYGGRVLLVPLVEGASTTRTIARAGRGVA